MQYFFKKTSYTSQKGFTLVETLVAIFILVVAVTALMTIAKNDFYVVRYARNQMVANTLMQEGLEYVRKDRDTTLQQGGTWAAWLAKYKNCNTSSGKKGCMVDPYRIDNKRITACSATNGCSALTYYPNETLYAYGNASKSIDYGTIDYSGAYATAFKRMITVDSIPVAGDANEALVTSTVTWYNGSQLQTQSQSTVLSNWSPY